MNKVYWFVCFGTVSLLIGGAHGYEGVTVTNGGTHRVPLEKRFFTVRRALLSLLIALVSAASIAGVVQGSEGHRIVFLNLTMVNGVISLDNVNIVPGKLKTPKSLALVPGRILFTVFGEDRSRLYEGVVRDPSNIRYEYVGEDGLLKSKWVVTDSVSFSVRMPYQESIRSAHFSIIPAASATAAERAKSVRQLGSVSIDLKGGSDDD